METLENGCYALTHEEIVTQTSLCVFSSQLLFSVCFQSTVGCTGACRPPWLTHFIGCFHSVCSSGCILWGQHSHSHCDVPWANHPPLRSERVVHCRGGLVGRGETQTSRPLPPKVSAWSTLCASCWMCTCCCLVCVLEASMRLWLPHQPGPAC